MNIQYLNSLEENTLNINKNIKFLYLKKDKNNREIFIYKLNNVNCTGISLSYPNLLLHSKNKLYLPIKEKTMSLNQSTIYENLDMKFNYIGKNNLNIINIPVFFFNYNLDNYYHFLYDALPNLYTYIFLKKNIPELKIIMYYPEQKNKFCNFIYEFLDLLNIKKDDILIFNENNNYNTIYITTSYTHDIDSNLPPRKEIFEIYNILRKNALKLSNKITNYPEKIYVSRRTWIHNNLTNIGTNYTTRRKIMNEDELVLLLESKGYTEVFTENLNTIEKINLFYNAKSIIGAIGGGIANVLFSQKKCQLIALISPNFLDINNRFKFSLDNINTIYFKDCNHYENTEFKKYMRIKINNSNIIGEIIDINNNILKINYTDGSNTGWNNNNKYNIIEVNINNITRLDNGLNSAYLININNLINYL
jgi:capsular polysaccharide biosynthesis protein